jgi:hypothetical protein
MPRVRNDFPNFDLEFATDVGAQIEPSSVEKATGWQVDQKPPARKFNWLLDAGQKWFRHSLAQTFGNVVSVQTPPVSPGSGIVWQQDLGYWISGSTGTQVYYSYDGVEWTAGGTTSAGVTPRTGYADTSNRTIFAVGSNIEYTTNPIALAFSSTSRGVGTITALGIGANSDYVVVAGASGVEYSSSVASGSWFTAATPPAETLVDVVGTNLFTTWLGISATGKIYRSTNQGNSWSQIANLTSSMSGFTFGTIDYDTVSGIAMVAGYNSSTNKTGVAYSSDGGVTWTVPTVDFPDWPAAGKVPQVRGLGGKIWVIGMDTDSTDNYRGPGLFFSLDGGKNWLDTRTNDGLDYGIPNVGDVRDMYWSGSRLLVQTVAAPYFYIGSNVPQ